MHANVSTMDGESVELSLQERNSLVQQAFTEGSTYSIDQWLTYLDNINPNWLDLGLDRVRKVAQRLNLFTDIERLESKIVTVAGTNGKGSTSALIASALNNMGISVGLFTSPHLIKFNERININGTNISNDALTSALYDVIQAQNGIIFKTPLDEITKATDKLNETNSVLQESTIKNDTQKQTSEHNLAEDKESSADAEFDFVPSSSLPLDKSLAYEHDVVHLTYYEIVTLAAMRAFIKAQCELMVLEVGLGGRLDAVNIFFNDLSVITSIGLDHMQLLGNDVEKIAYEKAGIIKPHTEVIIGTNMDESAFKAILSHSHYQSSHPYIENVDYSVQVVDKQDLRIDDGKRFVQNHEICYQDNTINHKLYFPYPRIPLSCVAPALNTIFKLTDLFSLVKDGYDELHAIATAMETVALPGRMQRVNEEPRVYLDVAHNAPAAQHLQEQLLHLALGRAQFKATQLDDEKQELVKSYKTRAVVGMLKDKDIETVLKTLKDSFDEFYCVTLDHERGADASRLCTCLQEHLDKNQTVEACSNVQEALTKVLQASSSLDMIVVFGSFITVSEALKYFKVELKDTLV